MTGLRHAAQQALEVLENSRSLEPVDVDWVKGKRKAVIAALRAALAEPNKCTHGVTDGNCKECYMAEPEQEPVAWQWLNTANFRKKIPADATPAHWRPLYPAPPQRKPLTDEEINDIWEKKVPFIEEGGDWFRIFARAIEAAHGIGEKHE